MFAKISMFLLLLNTSSFFEKIFVRANACDKKDGNEYE